MDPVIPDKVFFKIGEVAEIAEVEQHVLRYWEDEFDTLCPDKNRSGQRFLSGQYFFSHFILLLHFTKCFNTRV